MNKKVSCVGLFGGNLKYFEASIYISMIYAEFDS